MRSGVPATFKDRIREVNARLYLSKDRPVFTGTVVNENNTFFSYDDSLYNGKLLRVGVKNSGFGSQYSLYYQYVQPGDAGWLTPAWTLGCAIPTIDGTNYGFSAYVSCAGNTAYIGSDNKLFKTTFNGTAWSAPSQVLDNQGMYTTPAAVSADECIISLRSQGAMVGYQQVNTYFKYVYQSTATDLPILLPANFSQEPEMCAIKHQGRIWVYLTDQTGAKPFYFYIKGGASSLEPVLPIDKIDDENGFLLGGVSVIANKVFLSGVLKRKYGGNLAAYLLGPDNFSMGRNMMIGSTDKPGKLYLFGSSLWYVGFGVRFSAAQTPLFGAAHSTVEVGKINSLSLGASVGQAGSLSVNLGPGTTVAPGDELELKVTANGQTFSQARFGVDAISETLSSDGNTRQLQASSIAMKKLNDWKADAYFDVYSQTHTFAQASDLTKAIRTSGRWGTEGGKFGYLELNRDGILYVSQMASQGGLIRQKFIHTVNSIYGVGCAYGEETLAEAALRLGKNVEDVAPSERLKYGVFAIFAPAKTGGYTAKRFGLWAYTTGGPTTPVGENGVDYEIPYIWNELITISETVYAEGRELWIELLVQDGVAKATLYPDDGTDRRTKLEYKALPFYAKNTITSSYGRGAIYAHNRTGWSLAYAFGSDTTVIPLVGSQNATFEKTGVPMDLEAWGMFSGSSVVKVDSEQILVGGYKRGDHIAGGELDAGSYRFGKVLAKSANFLDTPTGSDITFAHTRQNNYAVQTFTSPEKGWASAVRVWLKKVGNPEDGVEISLYGGEMTSAEPLGQVMTNGALGAEKISADGGYVTVPFSRAVELAANTPYRIIIARAKNPTHPNAENHYQVKLAPTGYPYPMQLFAEDNDQWFPQAHALGFQFYGTVDEPGGKPAVCVALSANMSATTTEYTNMALVCSEGTGKGAAFKVLSSRTIPTSGIGVFYVDPPPGRIFDDTSKIRIVPALYNLTRGYNATAKASHSAFTQVDQYHLTPPLVGLKEFEYYSTDEDRSLHEIAEMIARKAGVEETVSINLHPTPVTPSTNSFILNRKNVIAELTLPALALNQTLDIAVREGSGQNALLRFTNESGVLIWRYIVNNTLIAYSDTAKDYLAGGDLRVSVFDDRFSAWLNKRLVFAENLPALPGDGFNLRGTYAGVVDVFIPEACTRVDNFGFDMARSGTALLAKLVGQKRIFTQDDGEGRLRVFINRPLINTSGTPERRVSEASIIDTETGAATRLMVEGGEIVEVTDSANLATRGNFFDLVSIAEINSVQDAQYFAGVLLEDAGLNYERVRLAMPADPIYEPGDEFYVTLPEGVRRCVIDGIDYSLQLGVDDVTYEQNINGRLRP